MRKGKCRIQSPETRIQSCGPERLNNGWTQMNTDSPEFRNQNAKERDRGIERSRDRVEGSGRSEKLEARTLSAERSQKAKAKAADG
jgi:hypothetical protein